MANEIVDTKVIEQVSDNLYKGVTDIIDNARQEVVVYVNKHSDMMFWHIGRYINEDMGYKQYSAYGSKILATLSQRLTARYGKGYTYSAVTRMMKVARYYSDEETFAAAENRTEKTGKAPYNLHKKTTVNVAFRLARTIF